MSSYRNIILIFSLVRKGFLTFCFSLYEMVDSEYSTDNYKSWSSNKKSISVGAVIKNPEMVRFVPGHFKTKNMC